MGTASERCRWIGRSGLCYTYIVTPLPCSFHASQTGNFIFARKDPLGRWVPVFIGHGNLAVACSPINDLWQDILSHDATHIHCHLNESEQDRDQEQEDLLARYRNACKAYGCNPARPAHIRGRSGSNPIKTLPDAPDRLSFPLGATLPSGITDPPEPPPGHHAPRTPPGSW